MKAILTKSIKTTILLLFLLSFSQLGFGQKLKFDVFSSVDIDAETIELVPGTLRQNFSTLIVDYDNKRITLFGGDYVVKETFKNVDGFTTNTKFVCADAYGQVCVIDYITDPSKDWSTRHMFFIIFENQKYGKLLCSNDPVSIKNEESRPAQRSSVRVEERTPKLKVPTISGKNDWQKVIITYDEKDVKGLTRVQYLKVSSGWGGSMAQNLGYNNCLKNLQKKAAKLRCGVVLVHGRSNSGVMAEFGGVSLTGTCYK